MDKHDLEILKNLERIKNVPMDLTRTTHNTFTPGKFEVVKFKPEKFKVTKFKGF